ncbi:hypothetical protein D3C87_1856200 [compost metagenome]
MQEVVGVAGHDLYVLESQFIGHLQHFLDRVADDDFAAIRPGLGRDAGGGQDGQLAFDFGQGVLRQLFTVGQQHGG